MDFLNFTLGCEDQKVAEEQQSRMMLQVFADTAKDLLAADPKPVCRLFSMRDLRSRRRVGYMSSFLTDPPLPHIHAVDVRPPAITLNCSQILSDLFQPSATSPSPTNPQIESRDDDSVSSTTEEESSQPFQTPPYCTVIKDIFIVDHSTGATHVRTGHQSLSSGKSDPTQKSLAMHIPAHQGSYCHVKNGCDSCTCFKCQSVVVDCFKALTTVLRPSERLGESESDTVDVYIRNILKCGPLPHNNKKLYFKKILVELWVHQSCDVDQCLGSIYKTQENKRCESEETKLSFSPSSFLVALILQCTRVSSRYAVRMTSEKNLTMQMLFNRQAMFSFKVSSTFKHDMVMADACTWRSPRFGINLDYFDRSSQHITSLQSSPGRCNDKMWYALPEYLSIITQHFESMSSRCGYTQKEYVPFGFFAEYLVLLVEQLTPPACKCEWRSNVDELVTFLYECGLIAYHDNADDTFLPAPFQAKPLFMIPSNDVASIITPSSGRFVTRALAYRVLYSFARFLYSLWHPESQVLQTLWKNSMISMGTPPLLKFLSDNTKAAVSLAPCFPVLAFHEQSRPSNGNNDKSDAAAVVTIRHRLSDGHKLPMLTPVELLLKADSYGARYGGANFLDLWCGELGVVSVRKIDDPSLLQLMEDLRINTLYGYHTRRGIVVKARIVYSTPH